MVSVKLTAVRTLTPDFAGVQHHRPQQEWLPEWGAGAQHPGAVEAPQPDAGADLVRIYIYIFFFVRIDFFFFGEN